MPGIAGALVAGLLGRLLGWYGAGEPAGLVMATLGAVLLLFILRRDMSSPDVTSPVLTTVATGVDRVA